MVAALGDHQHVGTNFQPDKYKVCANPALQLLNIVLFVNYVLTYDFKYILVLNNIIN